MEKVSSALKKGDIKKAVEIFKALPQEEQECFFKRISLTFKPPSLISVLKRKLHPGKTYEDYHRAWLPPLNEGQDLSHYFPFMTYVMNAQNVIDSSDIFSTETGQAEAFSYLSVICFNAASRAASSTTLILPVTCTAI